jgi:hypothetical protein
VDYQKILTRAVVTAIEACIGVLLASGVLDLSADGGQTALLVGATAGASVVYNALRQYLESEG